jgi:WD40 repeat protein
MYMYIYIANRTGSKCRHTFQGHKDFVLSVVFAPQGTWLISGSKVSESESERARARARERAREKRERESLRTEMYLAHVWL